MSLLGSGSSKRSRSQVKPPSNRTLNAHVSTDPSQMGNADAVAERKNRVLGPFMLRKALRRR